MKRILLAGFALSLMITVASCREASEEKTEVMEETSMEEVAPEAPVQEVEVEEVVVDTLQVETPAAE